MNYMAILKFSKFHFLTPFFIFMAFALSGCQTHTHKDVTLSCPTLSGSQFLMNDVSRCSGILKPIECASDIRAANAAFREASQVAVGEKIYWSNVRTGTWGTFCPVRDGHAACGNYCREFAAVVHMHGSVKRVYGTACRRPNGTWYVVDF